MKLVMVLLYLDACDFFTPCVTIAVSMGCGVAVCSLAGCWPELLP
jgi:hypothetical protein